MTNYYITPKLRLLFDDAIENDSQLAEKFKQDWERIQTMDSFEFEDWVKTATPEALTNFHNYSDYKLKYNNFGPKVKRFIRSCGRFIQRIDSFDFTSLLIYAFLFGVVMSLFTVLKIPLWIAALTFGISVFLTWLFTL